jgi:hypothetical protein
MSLLKESQPSQLILDLQGQPNSELFSADATTWDSSIIDKDTSVVGEQQSFLLFEFAFAFKVIF